MGAVYVVHGIGVSYPSSRNQFRFEGFPEYNFDSFSGFLISCGLWKEYITCWNEGSDELYEEIKLQEKSEVAKDSLAGLDSIIR